MRLRPTIFPQMTLEIWQKGYNSRMEGVWIFARVTSIGRR